MARVPALNLAAWVRWLRHGAVPGGMIAEFDISHDVAVAAERSALWKGTEQAVRVMGLMDAPFVRK